MSNSTTTPKSGSHQRNQSQDRAAHAWECINKVKPTKESKEYKSLVRNAGADIMMNGLGQTVAFWRAKGKAEHKAIYTHLNEWLKKKLGLKLDVHLWIMDQQTSSDEYRHATREALEYLIWLKRFAEAELADADKNPAQNKPKD